MSLSPSECPTSSSSSRRAIQRGSTIGPCACASGRGVRLPATDVCGRSRQATVPASHPRQCFAVFYYDAVRRRSLACECRRRRRRCGTAGRASWDLTRVTPSNMQRNLCLELPRLVWFGSFVQETRLGVLPGLLCLSAPLYASTLLVLWNSINVEYKCVPHALSIK